MFNDNGYTYTELTIVLAVIAILSAVTIPSFNAVHRYQLKQQAEIVRDTIRYAQKLAMSENKPFEVRITGNNIMEIFDDTTSQKKILLEKGVEFDPTLLTIIKYTSKGTQEPSVTIGNFKLKNEYQIDINIETITGRIELGEITN